jgi:hypothetical protein
LQTIGSEESVNAKQAGCNAQDQHHSQIGCNEQDDAFHDFPLINPQYKKGESRLRRR